MRNARSGHVLARRLEGAFDSPSRNRGLLGRASLGPDEALALAPCTSIHTFFMRFSIDVVFVRRDGVVIQKYSDVRPWRLRAAWRSFAVVELPTGVLARTDTQVGDVLELRMS